MSYSELTVDADENWLFSTSIYLSILECEVRFAASVPIINYGFKDALLKV